VSSQRVSTWPPLVVFVVDADGADGAGADAGAARPPHAAAAVATTVHASLT
jgi:hypothetical protein